MNTSDAPRANGDNRAREGVLILGAIIAASYLATLFVAIPLPVNAGWKAAGIVLFGVYALMMRAPMVAAALFLSAVGDAALALAPPRMIAGMAAFGAAHVFYLAVFLRRRRTLGGASDAFAVAAAVAVFAFSAAMLFWFWPSMGALHGPGVLYQAIITSMVAAAFLSKAPALAKAGAALFLVSDTLIAFDLYKGIAVFPGAVWITYAAAQAMLAKGLAKRLCGRAI